MRRQIPPEVTPMQPARDPRRVPLAQTNPTPNIVAKVSIPKQYLPNQSQILPEQNIKNLIFAKRIDQKPIPVDLHCSQRLATKKTSHPSFQGQRPRSYIENNENELMPSLPQKSKNSSQATLLADPQSKRRHEKSIQTRRDSQMSVSSDDIHSVSDESSSNEHRHVDTAQKADVQVTASFNLLASDIFLDCQNEVEIIFEKLKSVFRFGAKYFNKQQVAFILKTVGYVEELNEDFGGVTPEDQLMINLFYTSLKSGRKGVYESKLKEFLCLIKGLTKNDLFQRKPRRNENSELKIILDSSKHANSRHSLDPREWSFSKLPTDRDQSDKIIMESQKQKRGSSEGDPQKKEDFLRSRKENKAMFQIFDNRNFSFKKGPETLPELLELRRTIEREADLKENIPKPNITATRNLLDELTECWAKKKAEKLMEKRTENKSVKSECLVSSQRHKRLLTQFNTPTIKSSSIADFNDKFRRARPISPFLVPKCSSLQEIPICPRRGKFLFSTFIRCAKKVHSVMVYEHDDLDETARTFSETNHIEIEKVRPVFEQIGRQKVDFVKSFFI